MLWEQIGNPDLRIARRDFSPLFCLRNQNFFDSSLNPIGVDVMLWGWGGQGGGWGGSGGRGATLVADGHFGASTPSGGSTRSHAAPHGSTSYSPYKM